MAYLATLSLISIFCLMIYGFNLSKFWLVLGLVFAVAAFSVVLSLFQAQVELITLRN